MTPANEIAPQTIPMMKARKRTGVWRMPKLKPTARESMLVASQSAARGISCSMSVRCNTSFSPCMPSRTILPPTTRSRTKSYPVIVCGYEADDRGPGHPACCRHSCREPAKKRAVMRAARESLDSVVLPMTSETAKQYIETPIPVRIGVRRSIYGKWVTRTDKVTLQQITR